MRKLIIIMFVLLSFTLLTALPKVMVTGYWPPTSAMIVQFSTDTSLNPAGWNGANWNNLGYDIYSFFPPTELRDFEVDYQDTWEDFWAVADSLHPVAIISFGAGAGPWEIEHMSTNNTAWVPDDAIPYYPTPNPPDDTVPVGFNRYSTLPLEKIAEAVNDQTNINAWIDWNGDMGNYLCEFMAYLVLWYKDLHSDPADPYPCYASGFTHVDGDLPVAECIVATEATIEAVLTNINLTVTGNVMVGQQDPTGTTLILDGSTSATTIIDNLSGSFTFTGLTAGTYTVTAYRNRMHFASQEVYIDSDNTDIQLAMIPIDNPYEFSVCGEPTTVHTLNTANPCNVALRIRPEDLPEQDMKIFTDISFYPPTTTDSCDVAVFIYKFHDGLFVPGELIYEADVEITQADTWNTHNLEYPILIENTEEYFVGYRVTNNDTNEIVWKDNGPQVFANGTWACFGSQWMNMSYLQSNWMIKAGYMTPAPVTNADEVVEASKKSIGNYPNPFNPTTALLFNVPNEKENVKVRIFDIKGRLIRTIVDGYMSPGQHLERWDGHDYNDKSVASGIYFMQVVNGEYRQTHKMVLMK